MAVAHSMYREQGSVRIDSQACRQCGQCARICPADVLEMEEGSLRIREDTAFGCIACGHCMMVCPEGAVTVAGRGISPEDLRPLPPERARASSDSLEALLQARRSVRRFQSRDIEPELLDRIVRMASKAPMGIPPWDVGCVVVRGRERVQELANGIVDGYEGFLKVLQPCMLALMRPFTKRATHEQLVSFIRPLAESYVDGRRNGRDLLFYDAPAVLIFHHSPYADVADSIIPCTYAMLAAESMGLGTTMIGGAAPVLLRNRSLCARFGVPEGNTPSIALIVGYPSVRFQRSIIREFSHVTVIE